jgi:hypothetical protein
MRKYENFALHIDCWEGEDMTARVYAWETENHQMSMIAESSFGPFDTTHELIKWATRVFVKHGLPLTH